MRRIKRNLDISFGDQVYKGKGFFFFMIEVVFLVNSLQFRLIIVKMSFLHYRNIALKDLYSFWISSELSFKGKLFQHQWVIIEATTCEPDIPVVVEDLEIETTPPPPASKGEIDNAIKALKNQWSPWTWQPQRRAFQNRPSYCCRDSSPTHDQIWEDKRIPHHWNEATIIRILKKGASNDWNNWCGITLLSITSEVLAMPKLSIA